MSWLLDTNVILEMVRPRPEPAVLRWFEHHATEEHRLHLSALTMAEIHRGVLRLARTSPRFARLHAWAHGELPARFRERILAFDAAVARTWGMMTAALPKGVTVANMDSLIAATALHHGLVLVTRNKRDLKAFERLPIENPWAAKTRRNGG